MRFFSYSTIISDLRLTNGATTSNLNHFLTAPWFEEDRERACYRSERNRVDTCNILEQYEDRQRQIEDLATKLDADKKESRRFSVNLVAIVEVDEVIVFGSVVWPACVVCLRWAGVVFLQCFISIEGVLRMVSPSFC
ncbi:hypothetical protein P8452_48069 [Trifolium repens]|nr:hypothetical protein P8452_48069 [Trifolium repens]